MQGRFDMSQLTFQQSEDPVKAMAALAQMYSDRFEPHNNLGTALANAGRLVDAEASFKSALRCSPDNPIVLCNLGRVLGKMHRPEEAITAFRQSVQLKPEYAAAHCDLGVALVEAGQIDEALAALKTAIRIKPDFASARWFRSMVLLLEGDFGTGWSEYEWRWAAPEFPTPRREFPQPRWDGCDPCGKTILLHCEQGFGDSIQFVRYAPLLAARGAKVLLECPGELSRLFTTVEGVAQIISQGQPLPAFDQHCPLLSLPLLFKTDLASIPATVPYLKADPHLADQWQAQFDASSNKLKIGLAWAGRDTHPRDHTRSINLAAFAPLANLPGTIFVSLQKGPASDQANTPPANMILQNLGKHLQDFADTAALISHLDLVITVDTAVAHLAAAMGKPVWIILPAIPDWRWLLHRQDSPWYPTVQLFRQTTAGGVPGVIAAIQTALRSSAPWKQDGRKLGR
jgi:hypothetical protein